MEATMSRRFRNVCAAVVLLAGTGAAAAQTAQPPAPDAWQVEEAAQNKVRAARFRAGLEKAADLLENDPRLGKLNRPQSCQCGEFVSGNILFALLHEIGHAHIQEMGLPVLGREEDAADTFATV